MILEVHALNDFEKGLRFQKRRFGCVGQDRIALHV